MSAVTICNDLGASEYKAVFIVFPSICHEVMGLDAMTLDFLLLILSRIFTLLFHLKEAIEFLLNFCH